MFKEAIEVGKLLALTGLVDGASGNLSFRSGEKILITRTGVSLDDLREESFVEVSIDEYNEKASVDQVIHKEIYKRSDYNSVLHCHGVFNVVLGLKFDKIVPIDLEGSLYFGEIPVVEGKFGSQDLAEKIAKAVREKSVAIVRGHGIYAAGENVRDAYNKASYVEHSCKVLYYSLLFDKLHHSESWK